MRWRISSLRAILRQAPKQGGVAKTSASETKASRSLRIMRLEASRIGDKLAREVKAADTNNPQAVIY
eukprot:CAMPEP_0172584704 /NCGR_PEP_ID=MMETSP1068-20121228/4320_1 /TAXON_ID=35684 /ORGANISM="Pseudopedinella elastica, Strain CCMP716" /LENGTH=66 /DNA_ID=CAMNT_0013378979 /DNA_START=22 /DNA_END=223 /DNA_ORIENTATION=+